METGLAGKRVLVTGGSGGIGAACVRAFAAEGARVAVHYHRGRERAEAAGGEVVLGADLTDEAEVDRLFDETRAALGGVDVCAGIAGVWPREAVLVRDLSLDRWNQTLGANLTSSFLTARAFAHDIEQNGGGSLVLISSTAAVFGEADHADYAAAKAGLHGLVLSLKNEFVRLAPGARVNVVAPGWTASPLTRGLVDPEQVRRVSRTMALRKVAQPEDIASAVVVLSSDTLSGHVTGQVITVAGGMEGRTIHPD